MRIKVFLLLVVVGFQSMVAQQSKEKFVIEQEYLKYLPKDYDENPEKKWPLLIFLHGSGERGTDINKIKVHGPPMLVEQGKEFPFIVISPQAKTGWNDDALYQLIRDFIAKNERVDTERVYLTGLSMGGYGTWSLAQEHPEMFAAIVPICGGGDPKDIWKLRHTPIWCFHGKLDGVVPITASETMVNALKPINPNVKFTVYPETYHDSWIQAYNDPKLYEWLLKQKKFKHKAVDVSEEILKQYVGEYYGIMGNPAATIVSIEEGKLRLNTGGERNITLVASSDDTFFIEENMPVEFKFQKNEKGIVDKILLYANERIVIPKKAKQ